MTLTTGQPNGHQKIRTKTPQSAGGIRRSRWSRLGMFLGPGLIAAFAGNDAGGIATYAQAGAQWKYDFIWLMVLITFSLIIVQEMCARMGAVTGKGLADLIREKFGFRWTLFAIAAILIANGGTVVSEFAGIAAALEIFKIKPYVSIPLMALLLWWIAVKGSSARVNTIFLILCAGFVVYIPAAFMGKPLNWGELVHATWHPHFYLRTPGYLLAVLALIGTTITPYMQIYLQTSVAQKGVTAAEYPRSQKWDTIMGCILGDLISVVIIIATAKVLFAGPGKFTIDTADQAARALAPVVGVWAEYLFAAGLFGASMLAAAVVPLATAYFICEAIGWQSDVSSDFEDAKAFYFIFSGILVIGAAVALIPNLPLMQLLVIVQAIEGCMLPILLVFIMLLINDPEIMPVLRNSKLFNLSAWTTTIVIGLIALAYVIATVILPRFGINLG
ncbi:MAG: divalent metal cation transporter [Armatimonadota bacterium]|nr:divalent metal cation transporter [Armatimonadota bacterium]